MGRPYHILLWLSLTAVAITLSIQNIRSFDYWWALRAGQLITDTRSVPLVDPFSYTADGARWIDIHWLHQLGLFVTYYLGGHTAVVVAKAVFVVATMLTMAAVGYRRERPIVTVVALALMLLVMCDRIMARPELPSFLFLACVLTLLDRFSRTGDRSVYAIIGIQLLWANVHGLFAVGIAVCGIYTAAELLRPWIGSEKKIRFDRVVPLTIVTVLSMAASFVNPNFADGALYPIHQLGMIASDDGAGAFGSMIAELRPLFDPTVDAPPLVLALVIAIGSLSLAAMLLNWRRVEASDVLLWNAFVYLTLSAQRNRALLGIVGAAVLMRNAQSLLDRHPLSPRVQAALATLVSLSLFGLAGDVYVGNFYERLGAIRETGFGIQSLHYPVGATEWIARERPPGPIAHRMFDGGYLIWRLYPDYSVMLDGRLEVYGDEKFARLQDWSSENFSLLDEQYRFGTVLIHYSMVESGGIIARLHRADDWELTYADDVAMVFVRIPDGGQALYPAAELDSENFFPALDAEPSRNDMLRRSARATFYYSMDREARALRIWEESLALYPDMPGGHATHALLLHANGRDTEADEVLREWIGEDPEDAERHAYVADYYRAAARPRLARKHYERAIQLKPNDIQSRMQLGILFEREGKVEDAIAVYERVVDLVRDDVPVALEAAQRIRLLRAKRAPDGATQRE
jgi:tetratricopeptide (TPR) repeat protein